MITLGQYEFYWFQYWRLWRIWRRPRWGSLLWCFTMARREFDNWQEQSFLWQLSVGPVCILRRRERAAVKLGWIK